MGYKDIRPIHELLITPQTGHGGDSEGFRFFDLPKKVRYMVYEQFVTDHELLVEFGIGTPKRWRPFDQGAEASRARKSKGQLRKLMRTCKQAYSEVIPTFYKNVTICYRNLEYLSDTLSRIGPNGRAGVKALRHITNSDGWITDTIFRAKTSHMRELVNVKKATIYLHPIHYERHGCDRGPGKGTDDWGLGFMIQDEEDEWRHSVCILRGVELEILPYYDDK